MSESVRAVDYDAIIVAFGETALAQRAATSLAAQTRPARRLIVVENDPTRPCLPTLRKIFPDLLAIEPGENLGFARAANRALARVEAPFALLINHDVLLEPDYVERLLPVFAADEGIGWAGGRFLRPDGRIDSAGHVLYRDRSAANWGEGLDPDEMPPLANLFGVSAAACLYRMAMLQDVAPDGEFFDGTFESFFEDVDLDWRARRFGWRPAIVAEARAIHDRGVAYRTDRARFARVKRLLQRNRWLSIAKNDDPRRLLRDLPHLLLWEVAWLRAIWWCPWIPFLALADFARRLPAALGARRALATRARRAAANAIGPLPRRALFKEAFHRLAKKTKNPVIP